MGSRTAIPLWTVALGVVCLWAVGCGSGEGEAPPPSEETLQRPSRLWPDVPEPPEHRQGVTGSLTAPAGGTAGTEASAGGEAEAGGTETTSETAEGETGGSETADETEGGGATRQETSTGGTSPAGTVASPTGTSPGAGLDERKFGLTKDQRKQAFKQIVKIEDAAFDFQNYDPNQEDARKDALAEKWGLTSAQLQQIALEGVKQNWPKPPAPKP